MQLNLTNVSYTYEGAASPALDQVSVTSRWDGPASSVTTVVARAHSLKLRQG